MLFLLIVASLPNLLFRFGGFTENARMRVAYGERLQGMVEKMRCYLRRRMIENGRGVREREMEGKRFNFPCILFLFIIVIFSYA